jgi:hypothetical protein
LDFLFFLFSGGGSLTGEEFYFYFILFYWFWKYSLKMGGGWAFMSSLPFERGRRAFLSHGDLIHSCGTYLPTYLPTYLLIYLPIYLPTSRLGLRKAIEALFVASEVIVPIELSGLVGK